MSEFIFFAPAPESHQKIQRAKAQKLKQSPWWKGQKAKGQCSHCLGRFHPNELTLDHKIPLVRGGKTDKKNCVPSCKKCNTQRKYFLPEEIALSQLNKR